MRLTDKQRQILDAIIKGNPDGTWLDLDQLLAKIPYVTTKDSIHFSIRGLAGRGLIEKQSLEFRRGVERRILAPTALGYESRKAR